MNLFDLLSKTRIIPVTILRDIDNALRIAEILVRNSINLLEITLRTEIAYKCIREVTRNFPDLIVGCGSVLSKDALEQAVESGAQFGVAPSLDMDIVDYSISKKIPFLPGIATPSELHLALKSGLDIIKLFPATNFGGPNYIKAIIAPFRTMDFHVVPTGGINEDNIMDYLQQERVIACGATYIVDSKLIEKGDFLELENRIKKMKVMVNSITE